MTLIVKKVATKPMNNHSIFLRDELLVLVLVLVLVVLPLLLEVLVLILLRLLVILENDERVFEWCV